MSGELDEQSSIESLHFPLWHGVILDYGEWVFRGVRYYSDDAY